MPDAGNLIRLRGFIFPGAGAESKKTAMFKKINLIKVYEILRYVVYFLGGAVLIKEGKTEEGIGVITLGAATFAKDKTRAKELKKIKNELRLSDGTRINGDEKNF